MSEEEEMTICARQKAIVMAKEAFAPIAGTKNFQTALMGFKQLGIGEK